MLPPLMLVVFDVLKYVITLKTYCNEPNTLYLDHDGPEPDVEGLLMLMITNALVASGDYGIFTLVQHVATFFFLEESKIPQVPRTRPPSKGFNSPMWFGSGRNAVYCVRLRKNGELRLRIVPRVISILSESDGSDILAIWVLGTYGDDEPMLFVSTQVVDGIEDLLNSVKVRPREARNTTRRLGAVGLRAGV
jgi:hypothetical protein